MRTTRRTCLGESSRRVVGVSIFLISSAPPLLACELRVWRETSRPAAVFCYSSGAAGGERAATKGEFETVGYEPASARELAFAIVRTTGAY